MRRRGAHQAASPSVSRGAAARGTAGAPPGGSAIRPAWVGATLRMCYSVCFFFPAATSPNQASLVAEFFIGLKP